MEEIKVYLDEYGKIKTWPSKRSKQILILTYLVDMFEFNHDYKEKEINAIIDEHHTFNDYFLLRRELINNRFLLRTADGSRYWRNLEKKTD